MNNYITYVRKDTAYHQDPCVGEQALSSADPTSEIELTDADLGAIHGGQGVLSPLGISILPGTLDASGSTGQPKTTGNESITGYPIQTGFSSSIDHPSQKEPSKSPGYSSFSGYSSLSR